MSGPFEVIEITDDCIIVVWQVCHCSLIDDVGEDVDHVIVKDFAQHGLAAMTEGRPHGRVHKRLCNATHTLLSHVEPHTVQEEVHLGEDLRHIELSLVPVLADGQGHVIVRQVGNVVAGLVDGDIAIFLDAFILLKVRGTATVMYT